jgi:hypothetical protein
VLIGKVCSAYPGLRDFITENTILAEGRDDIFGGLVVIQD